MQGNIHPVAQKKTQHFHDVYPVNNELYDEEDYLKDCPGGDFIPTILPAVKRIIAIGDIHGDLNLAIKSFRLANLIDNDLNWIADPPNTIVVQVGDQIDSCRPVPNILNCHSKKNNLGINEDDSPDDMTVLKFFNDMHQKATRRGGAVYSLLGNHELMNAQGRFDYVSYNNYYNFSYIDKNANGEKIYIGPKGRRDAFRPGGPVANMLACTRLSVLIIGSNLFAHAGILPVIVKYLDYLNIETDTKLKYLNAVVRKWLLHKLSTHDNKNKFIFINDERSPFWTRIYGSIPENIPMTDPRCFQSVKEVLSVFKIGKMIVGHTPQTFTNNSGINGTCYEKKHDNKLYRIDGGFSKAFNIFNNNHAVQILEILDDYQFNIITDDT